MRIGLISDTHGLLRPEALDFLQGSDAIVHGGDIGSPGVLASLAAIAPLTVVRGNNDVGLWAQGIADTATLSAGGMLIYAIHDLAELDIDLATAGVRVVVSGHSHKPLVSDKNGVLCVNPGSAGPRRFKLPVAVGELVLKGREVSARIVELDVANRA